MSDLATSLRRQGEDSGWRLKGAPNFRDLGGYAASGGRRIAAGQVFRSGSLSELEADDLVRVAGLGLKLACDLRSGFERARHPSRWPRSAPRELHLDLNADLRAHNQRLLALLHESSSVSGARSMMLEVYRQLPSACASGAPKLFEMLADHDEGLPVVIHCTAGKDRTGFLCALLLHALEVPTETIYADYLLSAERCDRERLAAGLAPLMEQLLGGRVPPEAIDVMNGAEADYLDAAFDSIRRDHGSIEAYLVRIVGLDDARRARLQSRLLVPAEAPV